VGSFNILPPLSPASSGGISIRIRQFTQEFSATSTSLLRSPRHKTPEKTGRRSLAAPQRKNMQAEMRRRKISGAIASSLETVVNMPKSATLNKE
jgi:hypothetical protein